MNSFMLKKYIKVAALQVPPVRRLFQQRDEARQRVGDMQTQAARMIPDCGKVAFAHWGEDAVIDYLFRDKPSGRYLDIGCFHPDLYSNTRLLHARGWNGVNIDPNPFMIEQFRQRRPNDVNLNVAVGKERGCLDFFVFHEWGSSNTLSPEFSDKIAESQNIQVQRRIPTQVVTLADVMEENFSQKAPDFMNVDVESLDLEVIQSNEWEKFRPTIIAVEDFDFDFAAPDASPIFRFMRSVEYKMISRTIFTSFFSEQGFRFS
ncbi:MULTISPECIES: FkbM family methyltransferase [unclassified Chelatococcus]|uniref:FkbM family methyltransferase n=1 Tax=unclassified Chelatococcus TaxID=2638111 RepID=UPI001BCFAAC4|nr:MULTISPECIES: FkbM family methyltransferase [unclassified Chelatococcus]MBS7698476.1 FkbM family methyltransferase [Chelatococcus sp. YT9]MBX3559446.1 FkbM family methyltransferase [Chelatococcus sp.]